MAAMDLHHDDQATDLTTLADLRNQLERHPLFEALTDITHLRRFMRAHVFAVWDFMTLSRRLQRDLSRSGVPLLSPRDRIASQLIYAIVPGSRDVHPDGEPASQLDLYVDAMREVGADTRQFQRFLHLLAQGMEPLDALHTVGADEHVRTFVAHTLRVVREVGTLAVVAGFLYGREQVIAQMFNALLTRWHIDAGAAPMFARYLKRHADVAGEAHGPMAPQSIARVIAGDPARERALLRAAIDRVRARIALWDGVLVALEETPA